MFMCTHLNDMNKWITVQQQCNVPSLTLVAIRTARTRLDQRHYSYSKEDSLYCYCLSWQCKRKVAVYSTVGCLSIWLCCQWDFYIWSLIIAEVADCSHRKQSDKQVSKVGAGAAAVLLHSCHWYTAGRQLKWAYVAFAYQVKPCARTRTQAHLSLYTRSTCELFPASGKSSSFIPLHFRHQCVCEWALARGRADWPRKKRLLPKVAV